MESSKSTIALFINHANNRTLVKEQLPDECELLLQDEAPLEKDPDLILLDWNGYQSHEEEIRNHLKKSGDNGHSLYLPVVLLARESELSRARKALDGPVDDIIYTPVEIEVFRTRLGNLLNQRQLSLKLKDFNENLREKVKEKTRTIRDREEDIVFTLVSASTHRDEETGAHIRRLGQYSRTMAEHLGWEDDEVEDIELAATMHDIGKIGIDDDVLLKPGDLTDDQFEHMKEHTTIGAKIMEGTNIKLLEMAHDIALSHHEKWDGNGYPRGISGQTIPEVGRLVAVVDVYDALVHDRVYRDAFPEEKALDIIREDRGTHFEPDMVDCFFDVLPEIRTVREEFEDGHEAIPY